MKFLSTEKCLKNRWTDGQKVRKEGVKMPDKGDNKKREKKAKRNALRNKCPDR